MSHWEFDRPADEGLDLLQPPRPDGSARPCPLTLPLDRAPRGDDRAVASPRTYHPGQPGAGLPQPAGAPGAPVYPWPPAPHPAGLRNAAQDDAERAGVKDGGRPGGRRWLIPAGIVTVAAVIGAATVLLTGGHPGAGGVGTAAPSATKPTMKTAGATASRPPGAQADAPLTVPQAQSVLARYTAANNNANQQRNRALLATVETGSSYAIDAGTYQAQAAKPAYPAFSPVQATFYIPVGEPASGPRWFVAQVANAFLRSPSNVTSDEYLLFVQSTPGGTWQNAIEPYLLPAASAPQVAVGDGGLAIAVSQDATSVTVAPGQLPTVTAASLDGRGADARIGHAAIVNPGNLADLTNRQAGQAGVPAGTVADTHAAAAGAAGQEFALLTTDGGALVFYTVAAEVTGTRPAAGHAPTQAKASYLEQFATYDPPAGRGVPRIVADYSGITGNG